MSSHRVPPSLAHNASAQIPLYHGPYHNHSLNFDYNTTFELGTQAVTDPRLRSPTTMPNFSSLTNSALVDALLTPSVDEQHKQQNEQDAFLAPSNMSNLTSSNKKRSCRAVGLAGEQSQPVEEEHTGTLEPSTIGHSCKKSKKPQKRRLAASTEYDDEYIEGDRSDSFESVHPKKKPRQVLLFAGFMICLTPARRSTRPRKSPVPVASLFHCSDAEQQSNDAPRKAENTEKPSAEKKIRKPRANRLIRKKPIGMAVPKTLGEANEADRMMWEWKNAGRNWEEIRTEWKRLTGIEPGGSSLSVRYIKLNENLARNGAAGDIELLRFRKEAEEELMSQLWSRVAEKMLIFSPESEHNPKDLQKRYNMIVRSGYDVEKLVEDDRIKHEMEQKPQPSHTGLGNEPGLQGVPMASPTEYDNSVSDGTGGFLNQNSLQKSHRDHHRQEQTIISEDSSNIFENIGLLQHQVDGLNEPGHFGDTRFGMQHGHEIDVFISDEIPSSHRLYDERTRTPMVDARTLLTNSLVSYHTDSE